MAAGGTVVAGTAAASASVVGTAIGLGILAGAAYDNTCMAQRVYNTPTGPVVRWVNVCY